MCLQRTLGWLRVATLSLSMSLDLPETIAAFRFMTQTRKAEVLCLPQEVGGHTHVDVLTIWCIRAVGVQLRYEESFLLTVCHVPSKRLGRLATSFLLTTASFTVSRRRIGPTVEEMGIWMSPACSSDQASASYPA